MPIAGPEVLQQYMGDSVGWYEGDALVVETINVNPQQMQQSSTAITKNGKVTERFIRYSDSEIVYRFTVEDSDLYSQPWTAELSFHTSDGHLYEYACHEGNYSMPGYSRWRTQTRSRTEITQMGEVGKEN